MPTSRQACLSSCHDDRVYVAISEQGLGVGYPHCTHSRSMMFVSAIVSATFCKYNQGYRNLVSTLWNQLRRVSLESPLSHTMVRFMIGPVGALGCRLPTAAII